MDKTLTIDIVAGEMRMEVVGRQVRRLLLDDNLIGPFQHLLWLLGLLLLLLKLLLLRLLLLLKSLRWLLLN